MSRPSRAPLRFRALAAFRPLSLVARGLVAVGAVALALTIQALNRRFPGSGGPHSYAREAFGHFAGFGKTVKEPL